MNPLVLPRAAAAPALACGAYLKNRAGRLDGPCFAWSDEHGDLGTAEACAALEQSAERLRGGVAAVAHDLHPDFHSTRVAMQLAARLGVPAVGVQHHHAHIAAVIAEQGLARPVIGLALDGVGLGTDGTAWGGEILWVGGGSQAHRWERLAHLAPLRLPGGDAAAREPWRLAAAVLHALGRGAAIESRFAPVVGAQAARLLHTMLQRDLNCPPSSGAGRWFDAAAGALGVSVRQRSEAEAAIALEGLAAAALARGEDGGAVAGSLDLHAVVGELFEVPADDTPARERAALRFHLTLADGLAEAAAAQAAARGVGHVVFGGGCFFNRVLRERLATRLRRRGLAVHAPLAVPCGDAGLALGQAWVAACTVASTGSRRTESPLEMS